ncbi:MAG: SUMF1/EgtB/PvdO family nonheme iron enzyme [Prevotella sp.]|nr:SUMF1/EgtB/PvdO family nonheme iron enzyme [Prevotella sp.]
MKKLHYILLSVFVACLSFSSCGSSSTQKSASNETADETSKDSVSNDSTANEEKVSFTVKDVTFSMVFVKGGTFNMGATPEQGTDAKDDEKPAHSVTLSDYYIGETEVTQALYEAVIGKNPADKVGADLPVVLIEMSDAEFFADKLSELTGRKFRLPTEAEWEFAARGGNKSKGYKYAGSDNLSDVAWFNNDETGINPVKGKAPNELGIYDMSGNVNEYCADDYAPYSKDSQTNPKCVKEDAENTVTRGGNFINPAEECRVSSRGTTRGFVFGSLGFRLVMETK